MATSSRCFGPFARSRRGGPRCWVSCLLFPCGMDREQPAACHRRPVRHGRSRHPGAAAHWQEPESYRSLRTGRARSTGAEPVTSGVTGLSSTSAGLSETFNPLTLLGLSEAESVPRRRPFSPFPAPFGPTLAQGRHRKATAVQFLTVREVAAKVRVSAATIYALCAQGKLPHMRVSNSLRLALDDIEAFLRCTNRR
jgi:excisionase family DNA binding protein